MCLCGVHKSPGVLACCKQVLEERAEQQRNHYLYERREKLYNEARELQLMKGAEKYPEPLNPDSWTAAELGGHSMQEIVDQGSYTTALVIKCERLEARVKELEETAALPGIALREFNNLLHDNQKLTAENKRLQQLLEDQAQAADRARRKAYLYGR